MVVDSSALIAIIRAEPGWESLEASLLDSTRAVLSAAALVEASIVLYAKRGDDGVDRLDELIASMQIDCAAIDRSTAVVARDAFVRYGKGRHPAALNFGDCFSYALAKTRDEPLLFKGEDFSLTDVRVAVPPRDWR